MYSGEGYEPRHFERSEKSAFRHSRSKADSSTPLRFVPSKIEVQGRRSEVRPPHQSERTLVSGHGTIQHLEPRRKVRSYLAACFDAAQHACVSVNSQRLSVKMRSSCPPHPDPLPRWGEGVSFSSIVVKPKASCAIPSKTADSGTESREPGPEF